MPNETGSPGAATNRDGGEPSKRELQRQMDRTRESLAETVGEIKETINHEVKTVKKTVSGVLDYREEFAKEPLVWSLGALSAGFALGYTIGYSHKHHKGGKQAPVIAFADSLVEELSAVGEGLVMPALNAKIKELFGFEFAELLGQVRQPKRSSASKRPRKRLKAKAPIKKRAANKK